MAKPQLPIDGKEKKDWKVTSDYGWRMHPVRKVKAHHNGLDVVGFAKTVYIEAPFDGKVIFAGPSSKKNPDGSVGGFGYHVQILFKWDGDYYISTHAHMRKDSLKVKVGQTIEAGTVVGIMGATGMVDGPHLHWEITKGKKYVWTANGKGYVHPLKFTRAAIAAFEAKAFADVEAVDDEEVAVAPAVPKVDTVAKPAAVKPKVEGTFVTVAAGDTYWGYGERFNLDFKEIQVLNKGKALVPGEKVRIK